MPHVSSRKAVGFVYVSTRNTIIIGGHIFIRVLPVSPFSSCDAPGISRYTHPEGEPCTHMYGMSGRNHVCVFTFHIKPFFPPNIISIPRVRADSSCYREIQMMWSQSVKPRQTIKNREKRERKEKKKKRKRKQKRQVGVLNNVIQEDRKGKAEKRTTYVPKRDIIPVARTCL